MPDSTATIHQIPLAEIDESALTRDRSGLGADALTEIKTSIAASGLRQPVELFALSKPRISSSGQPHRYGLLSGLCRLMAFRDLHELTGQERYKAIPAFLRPRDTLTIRREMTRDGWCLHITGRDAKGALIDEVIDEIERIFTPRR